MSSYATDPHIVARNATAKIVIIGFGSPIRGDDAWGPLVADRLAGQIRAPQVTVHSRHILTAEMAADLQDATLAIFIDAAVDGEIGVIHQHVLRPRRDCGEAVAHSVDAPGLLAWTEALYGRSPQAVLLTTRAVTLQYANYALSAEVQATVEPVLHRTRQLINLHLAASSTLDGSRA